MFLDFGIMATLIVLAHILRSRVSLLQNLFVPTAIIAGFLGLAGGPQGFDILPFTHTPAEVTANDAAETGESPSEATERETPQTTDLSMTEYPFYLVVLLFATLLMGPVTHWPCLKCRLV